ncbi:MAG: threonylcarbamoyl-AMP synthase [Phycisphaerales bacterium]|nr:threonylcarbamoyl-AMP synthase [Phycisphaerales bacterium]
MSAGPEEIAAAIARLKAGGIVAFPTETVYGLGADAFDPKAVARVFELKGRPANNPLIVHVSGAAMAREVVSDWPGAADALAEAFWPGPLSIVLPKSTRVPSIVTAGGSNVAVRCPEHPLTLALIETLGTPLVGPSANPSGRTSPTSAEHVRASFSDHDVQVLDGGVCRRGIESTVLQLLPSPRILRPGVIGASAIERVIGASVSRFGADERPASEPLVSPGLLEQHYAPRTPSYLVAEHEVEAALTRVSGPVVVVTATSIQVRGPHAVEPMPPDAEGYAAALYAALRRADARGAATILVVAPDTASGDPAIWDAIMDRLSRAAKRWKA